MRITGKYLSFTGDKSPDTETKAFIKLQLECINPKCTNRTPTYVTNPLEG
jgi:hypothetical protein